MSLLPTGKQKVDLSLSLACWAILYIFLYIFINDFEKKMFHTSGVGTVITLLWYLTWIMTSRLVFSQETCSCSPLVYQWTLDFSNSCNFSSQGNANGEIGIAVGPQEGVQSATCSVKIEKPTVAVTEESLQPVLVKGFQFVELGANLQRIKVMSNPLNFVPLLDGGVLEFTSEAASGMEMPSALIAFVFAENKDGDDIQLEWLIRFSTLCDVVPFQVGDSLGWMTFVSCMICSIVLYCNVLFVVHFCQCEEHYLSFLLCVMCVCASVYIFIYISSHHL